MENASKALIIAGAILLSIVLITLGVLIIGRGQEAVDQASIDDQVVSSFNQKFFQYEGSNVSGTTVNTLINQVLSSNVIADRDGDAAKMIKLVPGGTTSANKIAVATTGSGYSGCAVGSKTATANYGTKTVTTKAKPAAMYTVKMELNGFGYICQITITPNS